MNFVYKKETKATKLIFKYCVMLCRIVYNFDTLLENAYPSRLETYPTRENSDNLCNVHQCYYVTCPLKHVGTTMAT
jgi:hypothetical protein